MTYLSIKCTPLAVSTSPLTSPGFKANAACSNSFCMSPCPKKPLHRVLSISILLPIFQCTWHVTYRSPFFLALEQSLSLVARSPSPISPLFILLSCPRKMFSASSLLLEIWGSFQLLGRRESLCLTSRCAARILPSVDPPLPCDCNCEDGLAGVEWCMAMYVFILSGSVPEGGSQRDSLVDTLK